MAVFFVGRRVDVGMEMVRCVMCDVMMGGGARSGIESGWCRCCHVLVYSGKGRCVCVYVLFVTFITYAVWDLWVLLHRMYA